jgi:hypothetical protein
METYLAHLVSIVKLFVMCFYAVNNYAIQYSEQLLYRHSNILVEFVTYLVTVKINAFIIIIIKYHIFSYFIIYIYTVKQSLCINILNSENMLGKLYLPMNNFTGNCKCSQEILN